MKARFVLLGALAFGATLIVTAPATLLAPRLAAATGGRLALAGAEGTVWDGKATLTIQGAQGAAEILGPVTWSVSGWPLLLGRLDARLALPDSAPVTLRATPSKVELKGVRLALPAALLANLSEPLRAAGLSGRVVVDAEQVGYSDAGMTGRAVLVVEQLQSKLGSAGPLGDYRIELTPAAEGAALHLTTLRGPLRLTAAGSWSRQAGLRLSGEARADGQHDKLGPVLQLLGPETGAGVRSWALAPLAGR